MRHDIIIALGSNYHPIAHLRKARERLSQALCIECFSRNMWTEAIGICSPRFLNCVAKGSTEQTMEQLIDSLKALERSCGDSREERLRGRVHIDIDLLSYDGTLCHVADWERPYITTLYQEINKTP